MALQDNSDTEILDHRLTEKLEKDEHVPLDLYTACMIGDYPVVSKFVSSGVDLNRKNKNGGWTALMYAAFIGRDTIVNMILEAGADVNSVTPKTGTSALMLASNCGNESVTYFLLQQGANINCKNRKGETALFHAVEGGHINVVKLLLDCDADVEASQTYTQLTPLMVAAIEGHAVIFSMLLEYGAGLNAKSQLGETASSLAMNNGNITIINIIESMCKKTRKQDLRGEAGLFENDLGIRDGPERIAKLTRQAREVSLEQQEHSGVMRTRDMVSPIDARDYEPVEGSWNHTEFSSKENNSDQNWVVNKKVYSQSDGAKQALKGDISQTIVIPTRKKVSRICLDPPKQPIHVQDQNTANVDSLIEILQDLKLTKYHSCFETECIDVDTFITLTDDDLKQIGIDKLGPRKKILSYISKVTKLKGDDCFGNQDAESAIQEAHAFVEYLQAQVYKERQGRHELESYFVAERSRMDKITKNARYLHKALDEAKSILENIRSVNSKVKSKLSLQEDAATTNNSEIAKTLVELHNDTLHLTESLTSKINSSSKTSEQMIRLCTDEYKTEQT